MANEYANYATLNPLYPSSNVTLSNGNLTATYAGSNHYHFPSNMLIPTTGKWAMKATDINTAGRPADNMIGVIEDNPAALTDGHDNATSVFWTDRGTVYRAGTNLGTVADTFTLNDVLQLLYDRDAATLKLYKNGSLSYTVTSVPTTANVFSAVANEGGVAVWTLDFGQNGYVATDATYLNLSTANLPTPAPINYEDEYYIQAGHVHTNGATTAITLPKSVSGGAMARIKRTDAAGSWYIFDTIRGANKFLFGDTTAAEDDSTFDDQNLTGTTLTLPSGLATGTYVIEVFYMGSYFQIKLWTGTTAAISPTFATELDSENGMMLTMPRSVTIGNTFWHKNFTNVQYSQLSDTSVVATDRNNYSAISTTGFTAQADSAATDINTAGVTYVTYAWANSGPYQFGMYRGNRAADGPVTLSSGAPTTFTVKREDDSGTGEWHRLFQSRVLGDNENFQYLHDGRNSAINATATVHEMDFLSNGVKIRDAGNNGNNGTSADHIYGMFGIQPLTDGAINQGRAGAVKPYNQAYGGTITQAGGFWVHTFTSSGTFIPVVPMDVEYLVIAGGGGTSRYSGGGGAGGHLSATGFSVAATALTVTVGAGGAAGTSIGVAGGNSVFSSITATGGGYGKQSDEGGNGGSGGGGGSSDSVYDDSTGIDGQGNDGGSNSTSASGYPSGGGGGAGAVGGDASGSATGGVGGAGEANSITGTAVTRAGGGGGGTRSGTAGAGGAGGGGAGSVGAAAATAGTANTGGGAGGGGSTGAGAAGGSGIVIVKYAIS